MKKLASMLAALAMICSSVCAAAPAVAATLESAYLTAEDVNSKDYDLEGWHTTSTLDGMEFVVYNDFALLSNINDEEAEEFTVPEKYKELPVVGLANAPFKNCKNLKKINLTKNISIIDWAETAEEGIEEITVPEDSENLTSIDGVIYTKDKKKLIACPNGNKLTELTIPDETEAIMRGAFACCRDLKKVTMGENLEKIYPVSFWGCSGLTEVNMSKKVKAIGYNAFSGCSSLESIDLPDSLEEVYENVFLDAACVKTEKGIQYVDDWAVGSEKDITDGDIKKGTVGTACGIFSERYKLKNIYVPNTVKHITKFLVFGMGQYLDIDYVEFYNDTIPVGCLATNGVKSIYIFDPNCKIEDSKSTFPPYYVEHDDSFVPKTQEEKPNEYTLDRSASVTSSSSGSKSTFVAVVTEITDLDTEDNVDVSTITWKTDSNTSENTEKTDIHEKIQKYFEDKNNNKTEEDNSGYAIAQPVEGKVYASPIKIGAAPKYDTVIHGVAGSTAEDYALKYKRIFKPLELRSDLENTIINDDDAGVTYKKYMDNYAIAKVNINNGNVIKEITIAPEADGAPVKEIIVPRANADIINIPATVLRYVRPVDSAEDKVAYYNVDKDNPYLTSVDGIIYNKEMTKLIKVPSRYAGNKIVVPDGVKVIDSFAFYNLENVESVELPDSVELIGRCAFTACKKLSSIKLSKNLEFIGSAAFLSCTALEDIKIPDSVTNIGYCAFDRVPAVETDNDMHYLDGWLVDTGAPKYVTALTPREGTVGIARVNAYAPLIVPKSVTKMSCEMIDNRSTLSRADVYSHVIEADAFKNSRYLKDIYIYDPECEICAGLQTIGSKYIKVNGNASPMPDAKMDDVRTVAEELKASEEEELCDVVIHGVKNSTAEAYAKMYGLKFEEIDAAKEYKNGDINGDGALNVSDIVLVTRYLHGLYDMNEEQFKSADLNGDGNVDSFDMVQFRKNILEAMEEN